MSIAAEISRIQAAKESLKTAINDRGGSLTTELLDDYAAAVTGLPQGSDTDLSFITAEASDILFGKTGTDKDGNPVEGSIRTVNAELLDNVVTVPSGYIEMEQTLTVAEAAAPAVNGNKVTIYPGYVAEEQTVTVSGGNETTVGINKETVAKIEWIFG